MKRVVYLIILFLTISLNSCKKESDFILTDNEFIFIENLKNAFQADDIKVERIIRLDSVIENSIEIRIFNSQLIAYDHPDIDLYLDNIFMEFIKVIHKEKKYDYVEIQFLKGKKIFFYSDWKFNGRKYDEIAIQSIIDQLTDPEYIRDQNLLRYESESKYDSLLIFCKKLYDEAPINNLNLKNLGVAYLYLNEMDSAIYYLKKGRNLFPEEIDFPMNLAIVYGEKKQYDQAFAYIDTTLHLDNDYPKAIYRRGLLFFETGEKEKACEDMRNAERFGVEEASTFLIINCK